MEGGTPSLINSNVACCVAYLLEVLPSNPHITENVYYKLMEGVSRIVICQVVRLHTPWSMNQVANKVS